MSVPQKKELYQEYFDQAFDELGEFFNGRNSPDFFGGLVLEPIDASADTGDAYFREVIPSIQFRGRNRPAALHVSPESIQQFRENLGFGEEPNLVESVLTRAGVARYMFARAVHSSTLSGDDPGKFAETYDLLTKKSDLISATKEFDRKHTTTLEDALNDAIDTDIQSINVSRYVLGIALGECDGKDVERWVAGAKTILVLQEAQRFACLVQNTGLLGLENAMRIHGDMLSYDLLACALPMRVSDEGLELLIRS